MNQQNEVKCNEVACHRDLINSLRHIDALDMKTLATYNNVSWPTIKSALDFLESKGAVIVDNNNLTKKYVLDESYGYFLGIAVGATETKISLVGFDLCPLDLCKDGRFAELICSLESKLGQSLSGDFLCYSTRADYLGIHDTCTAIIESALEFFGGDKQLSLISIGISLPGIIDKNTQEMLFCPNIPCLVGMPVARIIRGDVKKKLQQFGITYYISHDTVAATVFEKESLYFQNSPHRHFKDKSNIAVLYLGFGFGSGYIINNGLALGASGAIGELGHINFDYVDLKAESAEEESDKNEYLIDGEKQPNLGMDDPMCACDCHNESCLERLIRIKVFNSNSITDFTRKTTIDELQAFTSLHPYRYRVLKHLVGKALNITINMLNVDLVILSGRILNGIPELKFDMETLLNINTLNVSSKYCNILPGNPRLDIVAAGAAIVACYDSFANSSGKQQLKIVWDLLEEQ